MQGLESLNEFKSFVSKIGGLGRYEDTYMVHAAEGETVVPMEVLDRNPLLKKRLFKTMMEMGIEPGRYIVGNDLNSKNPVTGQPEFFLKKIVSQIRKAMPGDSEKYLGALAGMATGNPFYGAIAGGVGGGIPGAILGGGSGYFSPGLTPFGGKASGIMELLRGAPSRAVGDMIKTKPTQGMFGASGKFGFGEGTIGEKFNKYMGFDKVTGDDNINNITSILENSNLEEDDIEKIEKAINAKKSGKFGNMSISQIAKLYGLGTAGLGLLIQMTSKDEDVGEKVDPYQPHGLSYESLLNPQLTYAAQGGVMDLQEGGESKGPGTGTSDSIPAMLSDGEFVMTADAVRGAGGGDRREGARKMYEAMNGLEARA